VIKYLGSKKRLVPVLGDLFQKSGATTALDLFTGTTRVAQEFKRRGGFVTAVDLSRYSKVFADCWIVSDLRSVNLSDLHDAVQYLNSLKGEPGYFTETFCIKSRFFQPHNGERVDAIRNTLESEFKHSSLYPILLTSLIIAADRVDSTTGVQMAYVKKWADRSFKRMELKAPELLSGGGVAIQGDAVEIVPTLPSFDLAYLDPPYNQHRYFSNYHIWETLVAWDAPEHYGVACKRIDNRDESTKSPFNQRKSMPAAFREVVTSLKAKVMVLSYNNESWVSDEELLKMCSSHEAVRLLAFDSKRYVGAQIGVFNPSGERVGEVSHLRNHEWVVIAGPREIVEKMTCGYETDESGVVTRSAIEPARLF
jgi:adenine-specific DNA-methyltransferase